MSGGQAAGSVEESVNRRAGHVAVAHRGRTLVWGGYMENQNGDNDHYWSTAEVWVYHSLTRSWTVQRTTGDIPTKCSGSAACVLDDTMYVVAGFHRVPVNIRTLRRQMKAEQVELDDSTEEESDAGDDDEEEEAQLTMSVEISCSLWALDLLTWNWTRLQPEGEAPLRCDKTACWSYEDRVYLFGGFGPPPPHISQLGMQGNLYHFVEDPSTIVPYGGYIRGWSNQLVVYNRITNRWEWPLTSGPPPSPRAAHSATRAGTNAYIFGGRHMETRLNDLHCLDLETMQWSLVMADTGNGLVDSVPRGRSWQSVTMVETGKAEAGLLLYGGFDNTLAALGDCWRIDLASQPPTWIRCPHLEKGPRLWHAAASPEPSQVMVVGGLTNNILAPQYVEKQHAEKVLHLTVAPPTLLRLTLEFISSNRHLFPPAGQLELPSSLARILQLRCSSGA